MRTQTFRFTAAMALAACLMMAVAAGASAQSVDGATMAPDGAGQMHDQGPTMDHGVMSDQDAPIPDMASDNAATMADHDSTAPATMADHDGTVPVDGAMMADGNGAMAPAHDPAMDTDGR